MSVLLLSNFSEARIKLKSEWNESLEHVAAIQKMKSDASQATAEFAQERKASMMASIKMTSPYLYKI